MIAMKSALLGAVALLALAGQAVAADIETPPTDEPPADYNWSGFYLGLQAGYGWGNADQKDNSGLTAEDVDVEGFFGGAHAGYNFQIDSIVLGIEGDAEYTDLDGEDDGDSGDTNRLETDFAASIRARLGFAFDRTLIYATGGVAFLEGEGKVTDPGEEESLDTSFTGWTVGGGVDHAITDEISAGIEYRYTDYGNEFEDYEDNGYERSFDPEVHTVRGRVSWHFQPF